MSGPVNDDREDLEYPDPLLTGKQSAVLGGGITAAAAGYLIRDKIQADRALRAKAGPYADPANWTPGKSNPYAPFYKQPLLDVPGRSPFTAQGKLRPTAYSLENIVRPSSRPTKPTITLPIPEKR